jgi:hypothetical protein
MGKNMKIGLIIGTIVLAVLFLISPMILGRVIQEPVKIGYCPTMFKEAEKLSIEKGYVLVEYISAAEVLIALKNNEIQNGLIGRKAYSNELGLGIKEEILESGFTLVSNQRGFIDYSQLGLIEVYAYSSPEEVLHLFSENQKINFVEKQEALGKISQGNAVLIEWEDWKDNFELVIVMNSSEKVRDFRGVFLYSP